MLTPKDIENPNNQSGYDNVMAKYVRTPFRAYVQINKKKYRSREFATPLEAAEYACKLLEIHKNSKVTPDELKTKGNTSGYKHVTTDSPSFVAQRRANNGKFWHGKSKKTAIEAAQEYCDYVNKHELVHIQHFVTGTTSHNSNGFVYLMSDTTAVKIGFSVKPNRRLKALQSGNPRKLRIFATKEGTLADELHLQHTYANDCIHDEWFTPSAELFAEFGLEIGDYYGENR